MAEATATELKKEILITNKNGWFDIDWRELWLARGLIFRLFHRDFACSYKQTVFGYFWFVLPPLVNALVYGFVFGTIAKIETPGAPRFLFIFSGVLMWGFFASSVSKTAGTFVSNTSLFSKVYFPRLVVPASGVLSNLLTLCIQAGVFLLLCIVYKLRGSPLHAGVELLWVPVVVFLFAFMGVGFGLFIASLTTTYRDVIMLTGMGLQLVMFGSCVYYPLSGAPEKWQTILSLNPAVPLMETLHYALFQSSPLRIGSLLYSVTIIVIVFVIGLVAFHRSERTFTDTV